MKARTALLVGAMTFAATAASVPLATASSATAAATCYAGSCTGREPNGTTCANDAINARTTTVSGRTIILRYSPSCRAAWGKITGAKVGDEIDVLNDNGAYYSRTVNSGTDQHTVMVNDAGITSNSCGWTSTGAVLGCTASY